MADQNHHGRHMEIRLDHHIFGFILRQAHPTNLSKHDQYLHHIKPHIIAVGSSDNVIAVRSTDLDCHSAMV